MKDGDRFELSLINVEGCLSYNQLVKDNGFTSEGVIAPSLSLTIPPQKTLKQGVKRCVAQIKNGTIVAQYPTIREAANITGITRQLISRVLQGIKKTTGGYQWKYL